jgi:hypothetical protein
MPTLMQTPVTERSPSRVGLTHSARSDVVVLVENR